MQRLELDHRIFQRHHQVERVLLVLEKEVLGMAAGNLPTQRLRLLDREQRRVRDRAMGDPEAVEKGEQIVGRGGHGGECGTPGDRCELALPSAFWHSF